MTNTLFIDGPARGQIHDITGIRVVAYDVIDTGIHELDRPIDLHQMAYHVHQYKIFGKVIHIASRFSHAEDINMNAAYDLILSDAAKMTIK